VSDLSDAVCESCGSTNTHQTGAESAPYQPGDQPSLMTHHECLDCGDRWNVWH
jgi:hypothetical protein